MKKAILFSVLLGALSTLAGLNVRSMSDGFLWPIVLDASRPLSWRWEANDTKATVAVACLTAKAAVAASEIVRADGADTGSFALTLPGSCEAGREHLLDVTLTVYADEAVRTVRTARLAFLPSVTAGAIGVRSFESADWRKVREPVALGYSPDWLESTAGATSAGLSVTLDGGRRESVELEAAGGWTALDGKAFYSTSGGMGLALGFDDLEDAWTADLRWTPKVGLVLVVR